MRSLIILCFVLALSALESHSHPADEKLEHHQDRQFLMENGVTENDIDEFNRREGHEETKLKGKSSSRLDVFKFWNWSIFQRFNHWITGTKTVEKLPVNSKQPNVHSPH